MSANEVGAKLCEMCRDGRNLDAINQFYADDIVSVEASSMEGMPRVMEGIDAVRGKTEWWYANHDVHGGEVQGPFPNGEDEFAVHFKMDVTNKESGQRMDFEEVAVYTVKDGKIVKEEFFYGA